MDTFREDAELIASTGEIIKGKTQIRSFYADVFQKSNDKFNPIIDEKSVCFSENGI
jgi:hypothetical protein